MLTDILTAVLAVVSAVLVVFVSRRILGSRIGRPRSFVVGLLVVAAGLPFARWSLERVFPSETDARGFEAVSVAVIVVLLAAAWVFAAGVAVLVALEILFPTSAMRNPIAVVRAAVRQRRRTRRYLRILGLASRRGADWLMRGSTRAHAGPVTSADRASALVSTLNEAGVTFVKLGQVLSTRRDLVPEPYIGALSMLQTEAQEVAWDPIRAMLESELGRPVDAVFASIDPVPLAAASLAQVHEARLLDGTAVVVKVQRPGAEEQVRADADIIQHLAITAEQRSAAARDLGVSEMARSFTAILLEELDYRIEARNADMIRQTLAATSRADDDVTLVVPAVHRDASARRVLTMDLVDGTPISRSADRLAAMPPAERDALATGLMTAVLEQILVSGVFHADLHPGNVILRPDGSLGLIDFGAVGIVERSQRELLAALLLACLTEDDAGACDALLLVVGTPVGLDLESFRHDIGVVLTSARHAGSSGGSIFSRIVDVIREHRIALPGNLAAAFRSFATLEGCLRAVSPGYDMVEHALPLIPSLVRQTMSVRRGLVDAQARAAVTSTRLQRLPQRLDDLVTRLQDGTLVLGAATAAAESEARREAASDAIAAAVSIAAAAIAVAFVIADTGPVLAGDVRAFDLMGATIGLFGFLGILRLVRRISSPHR